MINDPCFCGSGKAYDCCHGYIHKNSLIAKLYRFQNEIDQEIDKQKNDNNLSFQCKPGCSECCSQCFCVSETEFVLILDYLIHNWTKEEVLQVIKNAKEQWSSLYLKDPSFTRKLQGTVLLKELFELEKFKLPFPCIFLNSENCCSIYPIRPLACRVYGVGYLDLLNDNKPCLNISRIFSALDKFVNLTEYEEKVQSFLFFKYGDRVVIRRPTPLFHFFSLIFKNTETIENIIGSKFYQDITGLDENSYIEELVKQDNRT
jgi:Fe-S-cluster containining protein